MVDRLAVRGEPVNHTILASDWALLQSEWVTSCCFSVGTLYKRIFQGITPVSDGGLPRCAVEANLTLPGETELGSAGTQPDKG